MQFPNSHIPQTKQSKRYLSFDNSLILLKNRLSRTKLSTQNSEFRTLKTIFALINSNRV